MDEETACCETDEEMSEARSSMPENLPTERSWRKNIMRHAAWRQGQARPSEAGFYYGFDPAKEE